MLAHDGDTRVEAGTQPPLHTLLRRDQINGTRRAAATVDTMDFRRVTKLLADDGGGRPPFDAEVPSSPSIATLPAIEPHLSRRPCMEPNDGAAAADIPLGPTCLRRLTSAALRRAVETAGHAGHPDSELDHLLRLACETARASGVEVEHVLIRLKECWRELPEARRIPRADGEALLAGVITLCIEEYFAPTPDGQQP